MINWETGAALGQGITARSPLARTVVTTLCGPFIGYLADAEDFTAGGHAATLVPRKLQMLPCRRLLADTLVTGALALIESLERERVP